MSIILINPVVVVNSVDLTQHIDMLTIEKSYADVDTTAFGQGSKTRQAGLGDHKVTLEFQQDFAGGSVEATIWPLVGKTTGITARGQIGATSTVNPGYVMTVVVLNWKPLDGKVGDLSKASVTWPVSGDVAEVYA